MHLGKGAYLKRLTTSTMEMKSIEVGRELEGTSPPSVFIGSWNYPKVYAGPMITPLHGDTGILDTPESWIPANKTQEEIIGYRLNLVRGKHQVDAKDIENGFVEKLQEISLAAASIESEVEFGCTPAGVSFNAAAEHSPYGPSAPIERFDIGNVTWNRDLEKVYYDTDLRAADAVIDLHRKGVPFSSIQKAFSVATMGTRGRRHLVPTRWSITACDSTIADHLLEEVKGYDVIDTCEVQGIRQSPQPLCRHAHPDRVAIRMDGGLFEDPRERGARLCRSRGAPEEDDVLDSRWLLLLLQDGGTRGACP